MKMKKIQLASLAFCSTVLLLSLESSAQEIRKDEQNPPAQEMQQPQTSDENQNQTGTQSQTGEATESYQPSSVTIDSTSEGIGSSNFERTGDDGTRRASDTKIHIYSGKHDGNNVINPEPKNPR